MGDLDVKSLRVENSKLKIQQNELSNNLGEEKEMVKYLHGVIKNYEHLLRSNSKGSSRPVIVKRNLTDLETDLSTNQTDRVENEPATKIVDTTDSTTSSSHQKVHDDGYLTSKQKQFKRQRNKSPSALLRFVMKENEDSKQRFAQNRKVKQMETVKENCSYDADDVCLEDLEIISTSSSEDDSDVEGLRIPMQDHCQPRVNSRKEYMYRQQFVKPSSTPTFDGSVPSHAGKRLQEGESQSFTHSHRFSSKKHQESKTIGPESIDLHNRGNQSRLMFSPHADRMPKQREKSLKEMGKELDRITSKLNKYEKSLGRSDKKLVKIENRTEYLEHFALGEESEWL